MSNLAKTVSNRSGWNGVVCLFGIGVSLHDCFDQLVQVLGRMPDYLCDNDPMKWERPFFGITCISPEKLLSIAPHAAVIITVRRFEAINKQLERMGFRNVSVACFDRGYEFVRNIREISDGQAPDDAEPVILSLRDKCVLITGASRGIGRQISVELAKLGSNLILHSRRIENTEEVAAICEGYGVKVSIVSSDLGSETELQGMLNVLDKVHQPIDCVFNNAAISLPCGSDPWDISSRDYLAHYAVNTVAPIRICYHLIPPMIRRGHGRVVNVSSTIQRRPGEMPYACSKAALNKFVFDLAPALEGTGVMISLVCPGHVRTDMGGERALHGVGSVIPGILLGALMSDNVNGRFFIAQDYAGLDIRAAVRRAKFYYSL